MTFALSSFASKSHFLLGLLYAVSNQNLCILVTEEQPQAVAPELHSIRASKLAESIALTDV